MSTVKAMLDEVGDRYRRYLRTTFFVREPGLRESFAQALERENLIKGPFLEITPRYKSSRTLRECLKEWFPKESWDEAFLNAISADRRLYQHQEEAIYAAVTGHNVIVATGTGSGKTESFLLPILIHLYLQRSQSPSEPGVKALILYPMNALVADQRERLGTIAEHLGRAHGSFHFTFGQYIGATPDSKQDPHRPQYDLYPNELGTRKEMQENPPDILITNYSMLEYLLIRPADSSLFDGGRGKSWKFLVLDEAHQYRGAKGMEMAMLIRRLKDRVKSGGQVAPFTSIATSASLANPSDSASEAVSRFASTLFGEPFTPDHVIFPTTDPIRLQAENYPDGSMYAAYLRQAMNSDGLATLTENLRNDGRLATLAKMLSDKPLLVSEVASVLFPTTEPGLALQYLDDLATCATTAETVSGKPLLSLRFHFLIRALEGVRIAFAPEPTVYMTGGGDTVAPGTLFDMALCSHCGQHFIAGQVVGGWMRPAIQDPGHDEFKPLYYRPILAQAVDREEAGERLQASESEWLALCGSCAMVGVGGLPSCDHNVIVLLEEVTATGKGSDVRCPSCDFVRSKVRPVLHGTDGPHAVIATALFSGLDEDKRKILAFADSRQRAAFFAWYLQDSYEAIVRRNLLYRGIEELSRSSPEVSAQDSIDKYTAQLERSGMLPESTTQIERSKIARIAVFQEILHEDRRVSLEGTGLMAGRIKLPPWAQLSQDAIAPWGIPVEQALEMEQWILQTLVEDNAVEFGLKDGNLEWGHLGLVSKRVEAVLGPKGKADDVISIDSHRSRRVKLIAKVLAKWAGGSDDRTSFEDKAVSFVQLVVQTITDGQSRVPDVDQVLLRTKPGYRVNLRWWRWHLPSETMMLRRCQLCNQLTFWNLAELCADFRCHGTLVPSVDQHLQDHHYRRLYLEPLPGRMRAEEHTAQLERELALQFQREFKQGHIHVLSSSTTFELGVDLGDLNVVFLRNVPPESFNYVQRVGRAGRRPGFPGIAVTYCGRSPHDLYHFDDPLRMISGETRTPVIKLDNDVLVARHWVAAVLSVFFRDPLNAERFQKVQDFFGGNMAEPDIMESLSRFCKERQEDFQALFRRLVPPEAQDVLYEAWEDVVVGPDSRLDLAVQETSADWMRAKTVEKEASASGDYRTADWAKRRAQEIAQQDVLSFLSRKVVIPKYGFPVDVVALDLLSESREAGSVTLQRDLALAISEFAPSAEVVANKKVWVSRALKTVTGKAWPKHTYRRCTTHNVFERSQSDGTYGSSPCCGQMQEADYVIPIFGFSTNREPAKPPTRPTERLFSTRPFFSDPGGWGQAPLGIGGSVDILPLIEAYNVRPGEIVVLSEGRQGRGFYICPLCGAADVKILKKHKAPWGSSCSGKSLTPEALGQQFKTDILRISFPRQSSDDTMLSAGLAYALQFGAAEYLEIPMTDLAALGTRMDPLSVVLYDNVPGGAGFVSQLTSDEALLSCIDRALDRVSGRCGCNEESSCYGCLRSYNNQFLHHLLKRGPVYDFLLYLKSAL